MAVTMKPLSETLHVDAPAERAWAVLADVARWPEWTPSVIRVEAVQPVPLGIGGTARLYQPRLRPATWTVTDWDPGRGFVWESRNPGVRVIAEHLLTAEDDGCRITLNLRFAGPLGPLFGWLMRGISCRYLEQEAAGLKRRCESGA